MGMVFEETETGNLLRLDGALDIAGAAELKALLIRALAAGRAVRVSLAAVTYLDVTAVQLLWAAEQKARQAGMEFGLAAEAPAAISAALAEAGFAALPAFVHGG